MRPDDTGQRVRDEVGGALRPPAGGAAARVPPQVLRVQQVRVAPGRRGQVLHAGRQPRLRTGLAQAAQELGGDDDRQEGQGGKAEEEQGLNDGADHWKRRLR